jgi:hypothetical protein
LGLVKLLPELGRDVEDTPDGEPRDEDPQGPFSYMSTTRTSSSDLVPKIELLKG